MSPAALYFQDGAGNVIGAYPVNTACRSKFPIPPGATKATLRFMGEAGEALVEQDRAFSIIDAVMVVGPMVVA